MFTRNRSLGFVVGAILSGCTGARPAGVLLENLTWMEAEKVLRGDTVVVIPLGARSKEHGPHLRLHNDWLIAEYLKARVLERADVVVAPTIDTSFYPAFVEYPGSISLRMETARDLVVDTVKSLARFGPKRFYVINTGVSTLRALRPAAAELRASGLVFAFTNLLEALGPIEKEISQQEGGTHADELETSIMLYIAPETVDMSKAVKDYSPKPGPLTRDPNGPGTYSPTGIWGDPTLATREKGERLVEVLVAAIFADIEKVRSSTVAQ